MELRVEINSNTHLNFLFPSSPLVSFSLCCLCPTCHSRCRLTPLEYTCIRCRASAFLLGRYLPPTCNYLVIHRGFSTVHLLLFHLCSEERDRSTSRSLYLLPLPLSQHKHTPLQECCPVGCVCMYLYAASVMGPKPTSPIHKTPARVEGHQICLQSICVCNNTILSLVCCVITLAIKQDWDDERGKSDAAGHDTQHAGGGHIHWIGR